MPVHIRTGDTVMVTAGNDKGAVGVPDISNQHNKTQKAV
jgi:ribosomal protein L24